MSQIIKDTSGESVQINLLGNHLQIGRYCFPLEELLPIIHHYVRGGMAGFRYANNVVGNLALTNETALTLQQFIKDVSQLSPHLIEVLGSMNLIFCSKEEAKQIEDKVNIRPAEIKDNGQIVPIPTEREKIENKTW